jgi:hypothetical protein
VDRLHRLRQDAGRREGSRGQGIEVKGSELTMVPNTPTELELSTTPRRSSASSTASRSSTTSRTSTPPCPSPTRWPRRSKRTSSLHSRAHRRVSGSSGRPSSMRRQAMKKGGRGKRPLPPFAVSLGGAYCPRTSAAIFAVSAASFA